MSKIEKKKLITIGLGIIGGLLMTAFLLKIRYGEINYWILLITGIFGLILTVGTILIVKRKSNE